MHGFSFAQQKPIFHPQNPVAEAHNRPLRFHHPRLDHQLIVVSRRRLVSRRGLNHGNPATILRFHLLVAETALPHQFHSPNLEPDKIIRVVHHAHLVGLRIAHAHARLARNRV